MKKELEKFLRRQPEDFEIFRINNLCYLRHFFPANVDGKKDFSKPDILKLDFDPVNGVNFSFSAYEIISRDYDGIKAEVKAAIEAYLNHIKSKLISDLSAGYRNKN